MMKIDEFMSEYINSPIDEAKIFINDSITGLKN